MASIHLVTVSVDLLWQVEAGGTHQAEYQELLHTPEFLQTITFNLYLDL